MKERCIRAVSQALGRQITAQEARDIEQRILANLRREAQADPAGFQSMTWVEQLQKAAERSARELVAEAALKKRRVALQAAAMDRLQNFVADQSAAGMPGLDAVRRTLVVIADGKSNTLSAETRADAIRANAVRQLMDTFEAVDPRMWGLFENVEGVETLVRAIYGEQTGNAKVDAGAKAWLNVAEQLRKQFNEAGGAIGKLEDWAVPQHHSQLKVSKAGVDQWVADTLPRLNRDKYVNMDGSAMSDQQVVDFLKAAWLTIATGGINKITPGGNNGIGMMAGRNAEPRSIHFRDATAYLEYQKQYGERSLWDVMVGHVGHLSREISMIETFGPNPHHAFSLLLEQEMQRQAVARPQSTGKVRTEAVRLQSLYDFVTGRTNPVANEHVAQAFDTLRNWLVASRLGSAVITALSDEATIHLTAHVNNLPELQLVRNELSALNILNQTDKNLAHRAGLALDTMLGALNRWGQDTISNNWSNKMASSVMRASGMDALDGARRRAFGTTMMSSLGEVAGKYQRLADIDPVDYRILLSKGITETDFAIWKMAQLEQWGAGNGVLTPESIMRIPDTQLMASGAVPRPDGQLSVGLTAAEAAAYKRDAVLRLIGVTLEETNMAVIRPGLNERFFTSGQFSRGTFSGEIARSFFLFKSFPIAMIYRHWMRGLNMETTGGKAAYIASLMAGTTVIGAVSQTVNDLLGGKNPRNYNPFEGEHGYKNWMAAMLKGGSLGIYGDFLFSQATHYSKTGAVGALLGPLVGLVEESVNLTQGNLIQLAQSKDTKFGAELVRFIRGNLPGGSLWYAKAALDHAVFNQLQEYFSPGYLAQMERRARKEFGQTYFWQPSAGFSDIRAPEWQRAVGQ